MKNKLKIIFTVILISLTCFGCKVKENYLISSYLKDLAYYTGISFSDDTSVVLNDLNEYGLTEQSDQDLLDNNLNYHYLNKTITLLLDESETYLKDNKWIKSYVRDNDLISKDKALEVIRKACELINNPNIIDEYSYSEKEDIKHLDDYQINNNKLLTKDDLKINDYVYLKTDNLYKQVVGVIDDYYKVDDIDLSEVMDNLKISGSSDINFDQAEVIPYGEEEKSSYINENYELLSSKRHSFNKDGFNISYTIQSKTIDVRISKNKDNGPTMFYDISLSNIKPTYKWELEEGKLKEAFFKVAFKSTNEFGVSTGKYDHYYLDLKNKSSDDFLNFVKTKVKASDDELEASIQICQIKTPIPNIPFANFCMDIVAKIYVSGKVELVFFNEGEIGFSYQGDKFRVVHDVDKDTDFLIGASARAVLGLNFNLETEKYRLMDIEFDGGVKAAVSSTLHLYDSNGDMTSVESDIPYSILDVLTKENNDVRVCGDVSLNWVFDIRFNTAKSLLYKYGLTRTKTILDKDNQIFKNKTHIENWQFISKCTRKSRTTSTTTTTSSKSSDKITLKRYSVVIIKGNDYSIEFSSLPSNITVNDLLYSSSDTSIVTVKSGVITAINTGSAIVTITSKDNKYKASINILVSTG